MKLQITTFLALFTALSHAASNAPLDVTVTGINDISGSMRVAIYNSAEGFRDSPHLTLLIPIESETVTFTVDDLSVGEFAVMLYQDVDDNGEMKTNLVGMPTEPWGASFNDNFPFGPPKWKHVVFKHGEAGTSMNIELH